MAATVAQVYTRDASNNLLTTVRSGADVVLSGIDSENGATNSGAPITTFQWTQAAADSSQVDLVPRASDTVSFTAPQVTTQTVLHFQLKVTDANGLTDSTQATVTVLPVRDADHFLAYLGDDDVVTLAAATASALAPGVASADIPFTVKITKLVSFTDYTGVQHTQVPVGSDVTITGNWSKVLGTSNVCATPTGAGQPTVANQNPQFAVPIPRLSLDDRLQNADGSLSQTRLSDLLLTSDVDPDVTPVSAGYKPLVQQATVYAKIQIASSSGEVSAALCVNPQVAAATPVQGAVTIERESLRAGAYSANNVAGSFVVPAAPAAGTQPAIAADSESSAHAYYLAIDPTGAKTTLNDWLNVNGFKSGVLGYGADAHAQYTNGFDLGFGRDMYMKASNCDKSVAGLINAGTSILNQSSAVLPQLIGHCDVAAVVINYASLQAVANGINPVVAVAMDYSAVAAGGPRFTKFYVFAPDTTSGQFIRVKSVDLDRRGEKSVPGACVVCHGGFPATVAQAAYQAQMPAPTAPWNGDLNAAFIGWDLASFLFSSGIQADPGFSQRAQDAAQAAQYTRAAQEGQLKLLNAGTYLTTTSANSDPARFALTRELLEGWYGGEGLPGSFYDDFVPEGWKEGSNCTGNADCNPVTQLPVTGSQSIYLDVFARSCRTCHISQVPALGANLSALPYYKSDQADGSGTAACTKAAATGGYGFVGNSGIQFPMGCYWQLLRTNHLGQLLSVGRMPFARRTMDRLWIDTGTWANPDAGGSSVKGEELLAHLVAQSVAPAAVPGTPDVSITPIQTGSVDVLGIASLAISDGFNEDALSNAQFLVDPNWQVRLDLGAPSCGGVTAGTTGLVSVDIDGASLVPASFDILHAGCYIAELVSGGNTLVTTTISVPPRAPVIGTLPTQVQLGGTVQISAGSVTLGNGPASSHRWWVTGLSNLTETDATPCTSAASACAPTNGAVITLQAANVGSSGSFTLHVQDADTASTPVTQTQTINFAALTHNSQTFSVTAWSQQTVSTLLQGNTITQPGDVFLLEIVTSTGGAPAACDATQTICTGLQVNTGGDGSAITASITINNSTPGSPLTYVPQVGWATNPPGGEVVTGATKAPDTFYYQIVENDSQGNQVTASGPIPVSVQVLSRVYWFNAAGNDVVSTVFQFTGTYPSTNEKCTDCHYSGATFANANTNPEVTDPLIDYAFDGTPTAQTAPQLYCNLVSNSTYCVSPLPTTPMQSQTHPSLPFVDVVSGVYVPSNSPVANSILLLHPAELDTSYNSGIHTGGSRCAGGFTTAAPPAPTTPATCDLTNVLEWIEDGANPF
jgi:hypothetical protein